MTVRKQEILYGLNAVINDIYHISEIEEVSFVQHERVADQAYEYSLNLTRDNSVISFNSPKRDAIVNVSTHHCTKEKALYSTYCFLDHPS